MFVKTKLFNVLIAGVLAGGLVACSDDDDDDPVVAPETNDQLSLAGTIGQESNYSVLESLLVKAELVSVLEDGEYTIFAPTDAAFNAVPQDVLATLDQDKDLLRKVLLYHVVPGRLDAAQVLASESLKSQLGDELMVKSENGSNFINDAKITATNKLASNGIVHQIDAVLVPASIDLGPKSIVDIALADSQFSTLVELLTKADLVAALQGDAKLTVFAPTNAAFAALTDEQREAVNSNPDLRKAILTYHVVEGTFSGADVSSEKELATLNGAYLFAEVKDDGLMVQGAKVTAGDVAASNGVIHVINKVMLPPTMNLVEVAEEAGSFTQLIEAAVTAGLAPTLTGTEPYTVFAPTDAAFEEIKATVATLTPKQLENILLYHVVPGRVLASEVLASESLTAAQGDSLAIDQEKTKVNGAAIINTNIQASNGVIHVIDKVLLPPAGN
ncbi:fasciclin domain-containing protein [Pseudobacteriovorax antillogorgiicola]|uniref:Uncaracterized surface protein containing fasciclin (FAS1) repeats n=1 Tax=Pseudobacteriovorax antillogorgiicola TaxID=1513793 RepID=A0A1Y6CM53_9BACT|nr:fasciclin domain-containing protein [Pseudobacteriovorax antillogorgiicola]TCS44833.1 putative surface protein with fasciclin (FAS1) repeats [Pseudobacteriovorax antillogorgiicola]SMF77129.1 Uncaracterized surface protein containing fasciclin (FAS1) repeats [Pseudobacteriovorax antillogorgiicola]